MKQQPLILTVDKNRRNQELLVTFLSQYGYRSQPITSLAELDQQMESDTEIGLAIIDPSGFDRAIWERCECLRSRDVPFLVLSPRKSTAVSHAGLSAGARGVYIKPLTARELLAIVRAFMRSL